MQDNNERQLVDAAVAGDIESFGKLCGQYYRPMVAVAYAVLNDYQLAEDAAQESFARALVSVRKLRNRTKFAAWLAGICRNVAKDMVTTKARQIDIKYLSQVPDRADCDENIKAVHQALRKMPVSAKELIVLRYYNNLSYEQISAVLGISKSTINGRLTRAKRKLAKYLSRTDLLEDKR